MVAVGAAVFVEGVVGVLFSWAGFGVRLALGLSGLGRHLAGTGMPMALQDVSAPLSGCETEAELLRLEVQSGPRDDSAKGTMCAPRNAKDCVLSLYRLLSASTHSNYITSATTHSEFATIADFYDGVWRSQI
jgi:hypothetical protein